LTEPERAEAERRPAAQGIGPTALIQRLVEEQLKPQTSPEAEPMR